MSGLFLVLQYSQMTKLRKTDYQKELYYNHFDEENFEISIHQSHYS